MNIVNTGSTLLAFLPINAPCRLRDRTWSRCKVVGESYMSQVLEWRERLESAHKQLQDAMTDLITNKNYSEAERRLHAIDQLMLDLIEDMGGNVIRSGLWT